MDYSHTERRTVSTTHTVLESIRYLHHIKQRPIGAEEIQTISELAADSFRLPQAPVRAGPHSKAQPWHV